MRYALCALFFYANLPETATLTGSVALWMLRRGAQRVIVAKITPLRHPFRGHAFIHNFEEAS
jgi:hypothetical protein